MLAHPQAQNPFPINQIPTPGRTAYVPQASGFVTPRGMRSPRSRTPPLTPSRWAPPWKNPGCCPSTSPQQPIAAWSKKPRPSKNSHATGSSLRRAQDLQRNRGQGEGRTGAETDRPTFLDYARHQLQPRVLTQASAWERRMKKMPLRCAHTSLAVFAVFLRSSGFAPSHRGRPA
jgi:hypothetical protein